MNKGFSLVEMIIVFAIMSVMGTVVLTTYMSIRKTGDATRAGMVQVAALVNANARARVMESDTDWGVKVSSTSTTIFSGASFATRVGVRDAVYSIPNGLTITGPSEIVFAKFSGTPSLVGTTTFSNDYGTSSVYVWLGGIIGN
ncbi:type II secretion system protein [Arenimonas sp.]|nr:type II secretion system protein [Candidatus Parcubacteria bacterium]